ncbi:hypothetical protein H0H92_005420, partial [Tricholoma furcatifolium]
LEQRMRALMKDNEDDEAEDKDDANYDRGLDTRRAKSKGNKRSSNAADDSDVSVGSRRIRRAAKSKGKKRAIDTPDASDASDAPHRKRSHVSDTSAPGPSQASGMPSLDMQQAMAQFRASVDLLKGMGLSFDNI